MEEPPRTIDDNLATKMLRALLIVLLAAAPASASIPPLARDRAEQGDTVRYLRELASPSGELRKQAGRWLARHLRLEDREVVLAAARTGDAESNRRRLGRR